VNYLTAERVLAYDQNRNLIMDANGVAEEVVRDPLPEVLRGDPSQMVDLINACPHKWSYRAGVLSFATEDAPTLDQQNALIDGFEQLAFAGLDSDQWNCLWVRHTHEDRVELHFCTPRMELTTGKSFNIAPPGYTKAFDSLRDLFNKSESWALDQISMGLIEDRTALLVALTEAGYEIPRAGKNYITVRDPDTQERWRLKGEIFNEGWTHAPERQAELGPRPDASRAQRLDGFTIAELQDRYRNVCLQRAKYNGGRYECIPDPLEYEFEFSQEPLRELDASQSYDDLRRPDPSVGPNPSERMGSRAHKPSPDPYQPGPHQDHASRNQLPGPRPRPLNGDDLHNSRLDPALPEIGGLIDERDINGVGARIARLRRAVGQSLRGVSAGLEHLGAELGAHSKRTAGWADTLRRSVDSLTAGVGEISRAVSQRCLGLQRRIRSAHRKLEISETRRSAIEEDLKLELRHNPRGLEL